MARCPECNKFVSVNTEQSDLDLALDPHTGELFGSLTITNTCEDCETELQGATFDVSVDMAEKLNAHLSDHHYSLLKRKRKRYAIFDVTDEEAVRTDHFGPGRRPAHFYTASVTAIVVCTECEGYVATGSWEDKIKSSHMDDLT